ncbi:MAG: hypothetical protein Q9163_001078 [Psora crenata]
MMERLAYILQAIGYHAALARPLLPTYTLVMLSAIIPIYTGAHASLKRPSSAAKTPKRKRPSNNDYEDDELEEVPKMEGLGPMDAIFLPVFAGCSLAALYLLIKWLKNTALLSKILNWYFSIFGIVALAKLGTDALSILHDFMFPKTYHFRSQTWEIRPKERKFVSLSNSTRERSLPLSGYLSILPLPRAVGQALWTLRELPTYKLHLRAYVRGLIHASLKVGLFAIVSSLCAVGIQLYTNLVYAPWYFNNLSGFAFVYSTLQILSPTTCWTATLILGALFIYDIYFVFYTPLMVEVATKLDIPAKMLFPRPDGMRMLGLGDLIVPGMVIGFALRFDLWLFYFRKQISKGGSTQDRGVIGGVSENSSDGQSNTTDQSTTGTVLKAQYQVATGCWGTRIWTAGSPVSSSLSYRGTKFPKPYFHATLMGYTLGMLCTLLILQVFAQAQPALLYLVPGVLGALWGTALVRGEIGILWRYSEEDEEEEHGANKESHVDKGQSAETNSTRSSWWKYDFGKPQPSDEDVREKQNASSSLKADKESTTGPDKKHKTEIGELSKLRQRQLAQIIHFSISYPSRSSSKPATREPDETEAQGQATTMDTPADDAVVATKH